MNDENGFTTKDFYITAFLLTKGFKISFINRADPRQVYFVFNHVEGKDKLVEDFLFGRALVEPKSFISKIKELKQLIHSHD